MRFHVSLSTRITLLALLLVLVGGFLWIDEENDRLHDAYLNEHSADIGQALNIEQVRLNQSIATLRQDTLFLAATPPVTGIVRAINNRGVDPRDKNTYETWEVRLQEICSAFLRAHPEYLQVRFISAAGEGRELVRVYRHDDHIEVAARDALQIQGQQDFFRAGLKLTAGRVHLSEFTLTRDGDKLVEPHRAALRAVTTVFDASGQVFGMLVVNKDVKQLFASSSFGVPRGVQAYIANQQGFYLLHPEAKREFAFEVGDKKKIYDDFPVLQSMFENQNKAELPFQPVSGGLGGYLTAERVYFDADDPSRFILLAYHVPAGVMATYNLDFTKSRIADALLAMLVIGAILMFLLRRTFSPLRNITAAAREISAGNRQIRLAENGGGEIGELSDALNAMLDKLSDSELVEKESAFRKELIEALPGIFYMIDKQGRFLMWNRNLEFYSQRSGAEIASGNSLDFFEGQDKVNIENALRDVFLGGEASLEVLLVAKDGTTTPFHFTGQCVEREGEPILIGLGLDISEQRKNRLAQEMLLRRNQALMQNSMEGIHMMDIEGNVLEVNEAFCKMLGYTRDELMQLNVTDWDCQFTREELRERFKTFIGKSSIFETVHRRKDGSLLNVEICSNGIETDGECFLFAASRDITARKYEEAMSQRHKLVIQAAMDGFWMTDENGFIEEANEAYAKMSGYTMQELVGMHISQLEASEQSAEVKAHIEKIMTQGHDRFETRHKRKDGRMVEVEVSTTFLAESNKLFVFSHNISQRKLAEQSMRVAAATFETHDGIVITDAEANVIRVNHAFSAITGFSAEEMIGKNPKIMRSGRHDRDFYVEMWRQILATGAWAGEIWDRRKNGEIYPKWMTITAVKNESGETTQYVGIFSDITERKQAEEEIRNLAFYDALTQLPNRRLFLERFHTALAASSRYNDYGAILFIDLDRFKELNDTLGHAHGDMMLIEVAARIKSCVREIDTVSRFGGDEFVVLLESVSSDRDEATYKAGVVAEKIRVTLSLPYQLREHGYYSSPSIGISLYHGIQESMDTLLKHADAAMYQSKKAGRNTVRFYDANLQRDWNSMIDKSSPSIP